MSDINRIVANIKMNHVYTCHKCGKKTVGDTVSVEIHADSAIELSSKIENMRKKSSHMPIGWASYYSKNGDIITCGCN